MTHGTITCYRYHHCRCALCTHANKLDSRKKRAREAQREDRPIRVKSPAVVAQILQGLGR
jgi:hypothetical protein